MIAAAAPVVAVPSVARAASVLRGEFASLLLRRTLLGALVGVAVGLSYFAIALPLIIDAQASWWASFDSMVVRNTLNITILAALLTIILRLGTNLPQQLGGAALAMLITHAALRLVTGSYTAGPFASGHFETAGFDELKTYMHSLWNTIAVGILLTAYYVYWDRAQRSLRALRAAQLEQQRAEHGVLESRLNVLRARVDPAFLFESLDAVRRLYSQRSEEAERLLEDLIKYLRATLPQSREQASSLADEMHLAAAYLEVRGAISGKRLSLRADLDPALAGAFFPPRVLMPIVEGAAARARAGSASLLVRARLDGDRGRVTIEEQGCTSEDDAPLANEVAMTLRAFFGPDAQARSQAGPGGRILNLEYLHDSSARKDAS